MVRSRTEYHRAWRQANVEKVRAARARYVEKNPERERERIKLQNATRKDYRRQWYQENKDRLAKVARERNILVKYGLTQAEWDAIFVQQGSCCSICKTSRSGGGGWATDHCHTNGHVRGILCNDCNLTLGLMRDEPDRLRAAADYLERAEVKP